MLPRPVVPLDVIPTLETWLSGSLRLPPGDDLSAVVAALRARGITRPMQLGSLSSTMLVAVGIGNSYHGLFYAALARIRASEQPHAALVPWKLHQGIDWRYGAEELLQAVSTRLASIEVVCSSVAVVQLVLTWHVVEAVDEGHCIRRVVRRYPDEDFCGEILRRTMRLEIGEHVCAMKCGYETGAGGLQTWANSRPTNVSRLVSVSVVTSKRRRHGVAVRAAKYERLAPRTYEVLRPPASAPQMGLVALEVRSSGKAAPLSGLRGVFAPVRACAYAAGAEAAAVATVRDSASPQEFGEVLQQDSASRQPRNPYTGGRMEGVADPWLAADMGATPRADAVASGPYARAAARFRDTPNYTYEIAEAQPASFFDAGVRLVPLAAAEAVDPRRHALLLRAHWPAVPTTPVANAVFVRAIGSLRRGNRRDVYQEGVQRAPASTAFAHVAVQQ